MWCEQLETVVRNESKPAMPTSAWIVLALAILLILAPGGKRT